MLYFGRSALMLKRGTASSLSIIAPMGLGHNKLESFDFGAKRKRRKSPDRFSLTALLRRLVRLRGAYKPCRRLCARICLVQGLRFPVLTEGRTSFWANECSIESPCTATNGRRTPYFREAGNKNDRYQNPI